MTRKVSYGEQECTLPPTPILNDETPISKRNRFLLSIIIAILLYIVIVSGIFYYNYYTGSIQWLREYLIMGKLPNNIFIYTDISVMIFHLSFLYIIFRLVVKPKYIFTATYVMLSIEIILSAVNYFVYSYEEDKYLRIAIASIILLALVGLRLLYIISRSIKQLQ